jgi:DNA-binding MarR family transcriptional regulator
MRAAGSTEILDRTEFAASVERVFVLLRRLTPAQGVSLTAASTLATLERDGPRRLTELAVKEGVTQPAMTQLVSRLERDGLARRVPDPSDGRVVVVEVSDAGRALLRQRRLVRATKLTELLAALPPEDEMAIAQAVAALGRLADLGPPN